MPIPSPRSAPVPPAAGPRRSAGFLFAYALASAGGVIGFLPLLTLLLPMRIERLVGADRLDVLTASVIAGAIAASVSNIAFGMLSDRSLAAGGGRRRWVAFGLVLLALSYAGVAAAASPFAIVLSVVAFQSAVNAVLGPLTAIMADEIPDAQKGIAGGLLSLGSPVASAVSALLIAAPMLDEAARLALVPAAVALCIAPLLLIRARLVDGQLESRAEAVMLRRDIAVAWGARMLVQIAGSVLFLYLLYYFQSVAGGAGQRDLAVQIGRLMVIAYLIPLPIAVLLGRLSDVTGRRKPVLLGAATVASIGLLGMALAQDRTSAEWAFIIYTAGFAVFLGLHSAFAMQLLPDPWHRGRDLGLLNLTNTLPSLIGPALTWALATPHDFDALMLVLAALTLAGGLTILGVRGRR